MNSNISDTALPFALALDAESSTFEEKVKELVRRGAKVVAEGGVAPSMATRVAALLTAEVCALAAAADETKPEGRKTLRAVAAQALREHDRACDLGWFGSAREARQTTHAVLLRLRSDARIESVAKSVDRLHDPLNRVADALDRMAPAKP